MTPDESQTSVKTSEDTRAGRKAAKKASSGQNNLVSKDKAGAGVDRGFALLAKFAGIFILIILAFVAIFLTYNSFEAIYREDEGLVIGRFLSYAWPLIVGTLTVSIIALCISAPVAVGVALYISHYAPPRLSKSIGYVIDLLAAIPSVVYGAWGMVFLSGYLANFYVWVHEWFSWIPLFAGTPSATGRTVFTASVVLSVMILPIITSVSREIFIQTPKLHEEAALALGATRWEMIKMAVFPFARAGIISGIMLGLGRALGETMAVVMVLSAGSFTWSIISSGNNTIPAEIARNFGETGDGTERWHQLIAIGLVLFIITLIVNMVARWTVSRHKEFSGAN